MYIISVKIKKKFIERRAARRGVQYIDCRGEGERIREQGED